MWRLQNDEAQREAMVRATRAGIAGEGAIRIRSLFLPDSEKLTFHL